MLRFCASKSTICESKLTHYGRNDALWIRHYISANFISLSSSQGLSLYIQCAPLEPLPSNSKCSPATPPHLLLTMPHIPADIWPLVSRL